VMAQLREHHGRIATLATDVVALSSDVRALDRRVSTVALDLNDGK